VRTEIPRSIEISGSAVKPNICHNGCSKMPGPMTDIAGKAVVKTVLVSGMMKFVKNLDEEINVPPAAV
jgi:hypothetical protein